ncbi:Hypothetical predicted protein, partial [Drosophila guanche]
WKWAGVFVQELETAVGQCRFHALPQVPQDSSVPAAFVDDAYQRPLFANLRKGHIWQYPGSLCSWSKRLLRALPFWLLRRSMRFQ